MIVKGDKLKNSIAKEGICELCKKGPRVHCHFDKGQEYYGKNSSKSLFSWRVKGDFTLPLFPMLVGAAAVAIGVCCLFDKKSD